MESHPLQDAEYSAIHFRSIPHLRFGSPWQFRNGLHKRIMSHVGTPGDEAQHDEYQHENDERNKTQLNAFKTNSSFQDHALLKCLHPQWNYHG